MGYPAIGREIADEELDAWGNWTAAHRGETLAVLVAGEVVTRSTIRSRVGKHLTLEGWPRGYSDEEYARLARALRVE